MGEMCIMFITKGEVMKSIFVGSPDKVSLNNFVKFLQKSHNEYSIGGMHSLMSGDAVGLYIDDFLSQYPKALFTYYAKRKINIEDPLTAIPVEAQERVDVIIWFNLYSTEPVIVKDPENLMKFVVEDWNKYISSISL